MGVGIAVNILRALPIKRRGGRAIAGGLVGESLREQAGKLLRQNAILIVDQGSPITVSLSTFPLPELTLVRRPLDSCETEFERESERREG